MDELQRNSPDENLKAPKRPIVVILDNIRSGMNVGSIMRTADALGIQEVMLCGITAQPPDRQLVKSSLGAETSVKWSYYDSTEKALEHLPKTYSIWVIEQTLHSEELNRELRQTDEPIALVFGNELNGVQDSLLPYAHRCLHIPQYGHKHSINVAVCAGIVLWELA